LRHTSHRIVNAVANHRGDEPLLVVGMLSIVLV